MYYLTGKNVTEHRGWSVVTEDGTVCCTISGGMGLMAALALCETLNDPTLNKKYSGRHDPERVCINSYDDNKIIWNENNVIILNKLYYSGTVKKETLESLLPENGKYIDDYIGTLIKEGWVYDYSTMERDYFTMGSDYFELKKDEYRLTVMGKLKCQYLRIYDKTMKKEQLIQEMDIETEDKFIPMNNTSDEKSPSDTIITKEGFYITPTITSEVISKDSGYDLWRIDEAGVGRMVYTGCTHSHIKFLESLIEKDMIVPIDNL